MQSKLIVTLLLLVFAMVFALQNTAVVEIEILFWTLELPRSLLIITILFIGIVIGWFSRAIYRLLTRKA